MKKFLPLFFILSMVSCKEISFKEPQPIGKKSLHEVPTSITGRYLMVDENNNSKDTLTVTKRGYLTGHNPTEEAVISDSLVLKYYKGYYFLSMNEHPEWLLRIIKKEKNGDLLYMAMEDDDFNLFLKKLSKEIKIDSFEVKGEKLYQIDPSPKQLVSLIKKNYFKTTVLKKID